MSPVHILLIALSSCLLVACGGGGGSSGAQPPISGSPPPPPPPPPPSFSFEPPPMVHDIDLSFLPKSVNGNPVVLSANGYDLELDLAQRDPVRTYGMCVGWLTSCFGSGERSIEACVSNVPACLSDTPWESLERCCPQACIDGFNDRLVSGASEITAFDNSFLVDKACYPGLLDAVAGAAP